MANEVKVANITATAREVDFVTQFQRAWEQFMNILGNVNVIEKAPGTVIKYKEATGTLSATAVAEGANIPYSQFSVTEKEYGALTIDKYAKAVTMEAINAYGYDTAVQKTDEEFRYMLQDKVASKFYAFLKTGTLKGTSKTFQSALAMAHGRVIDKFRGMNKAASGVVAFVNVLDAFEYLGAAGITTQNQFGFQYIQDFMGYDAVFLLPTSAIARNTVIATATNNIMLYYVNPSASDFAKGGLEYTTFGEFPMIGFHTQGNYNTAVSESFAVMGITLAAEYLDGVCVETISASGT